MDKNEFLPIRQEIFSIYRKSKIGQKV